jgi:pyrimidine deaminase RibD-like protein/uncharacterized protein (DUF302 family)
MLINFETQKSVQEVRTALEEKAKAKGFGVMAVHEVSNILKNKGVPIDYECVIVEVCSPRHASQVLSKNAFISTTMPCRIAIFQKDGKTVVSTMAPTAMLGNVSRASAQGCGGGSGKVDEGDHPRVYLMDDQYFMELALRLAQERKGLTHPNPTVGCVIVKEGKVIAQANHERAGLPHAEAKALSIAGESAKGSTLYVTLEPCTHFGRTPPCVDAIIKAGVKRVVIATLDQNPLVSGKGVQRLKEAGIEVQVGVLEEEAKRLNEDFFTYITKGRPYITLKFAQSLDGSLATKDYHSKWISSEESRKYAHRLRAEASAVLVGINTVLRDNPSLTVRAFEWERNPTRIVWTQS